MKFSFDADLGYQRQAIDAVTGLFRGQENMASQFTVHAHPAAHAGFEGFSDRGYGNMLRLEPETILSNLHKVQDGTGLALGAVAGIDELHYRDGDRHRQDLRLPPHHLRAEPALRIHQVHRRSAVGGHQGGRRDVHPDAARTLRLPVWQPADELLPVRRQQPVPCALVRHLVEHRDHDRHQLRRSTRRPTRSTSPPRTWTSRCPPT